MIYFRTKIRQFLNNQTLGKKIGLCFAIVLSFTIVIGVFGQVMLSRVMEGVTFYDQIHSIQDSFSRTKYYHDQFRLYGYEDGRIIQNLMKEKVLKQLGLCSQLLEKVSKNLLYRMRLDIQLAQAFQSFKKYSISCHQYLHSEKRKITFVKDIEASETLVQNQIDKIPFIMESIRSYFHDVQLKKQLYFTRSHKESWEGLKQTLFDMNECLLDWKAQIQQNNELSIVSQQIFRAFDQYRSLIFQYHVTCDIQENFRLTMVNFQDIFSEIIEKLIDAATRQMRKIQTVSMIVLFGILTISLITGAGISIFLAQKTFVQPILKLDSAAKEIAAGNYDLDFPVFHGSDEFCSLSRSFSQMQQAIHEKINSLHEAQQKYQSIFENAVEGIFQLSLNGQFISANPSMASILGYRSPEELIHSFSESTPYSFIKIEDKKILSKTLKQKGKITNFEIQVIRKNGAYKWCNLMARLIHNENKSIHYIEGSMVDISERIERNRAEQERKTAEASSIAKSEFLANMSHEVRTPMNGIIGMVEVLSMTTLTKDQKEYLDSISCSAESLLTILNDILDYSKIEAGKLIIESVRFNLKQMLDQIAQLMSAQSRNKNIKILVDYSEELPTFVIGDPTRIRQIIMNLSGNAIKFTTKGHVLIRTQRIESPESNCKYLFEVIDTGIGISEENQKKIFNKFTQADGSTTRKFGGTGLGLSICRELVSLMHGEIGVKSILNEGTTFYFILDLPSASDQTKINDDHLHHQGELLDTFYGINILLVEDNLMNQKVTQELLKRMGCSVSIADNGLIALEILENKTFDLIFMDGNMPEMDGFEATKNIRESEKTQKKTPTPIIAMTALAMSHDRKKCLDAGMDDYISKPITKKAIIQVLKKYCLKESIKNTNCCDSHQLLENNDDILNKEQLINICSHDYDVIKEISGIFATDARKYVQELKTFHLDNDLEQFYNKLHMLKGNAGNIGGEKLRKLILTIEEQSLRRTKLPDQSKLDEIDASVNQLIHYLQSFLSKGNKNLFSTPNTHPQNIR